MNEPLPTPAPAAPAPTSAPVAPTPAPATPAQAPIPNPAPAPTPAPADPNAQSATPPNPALPPIEGLDKPQKGSVEELRLRIDEQTRKFRQQERENTRLAAELNILRNPPKAGDPPPPPVPKWSTADIEAFNAREQELRAGNPQYDAIVAKASNVNVHDDVVEFIMTESNGADVRLYLCEHPGEANVLNSLCQTNPRTAINRMAKIAARLELSKERFNAQAPRVSQAPSPLPVPHAEAAPGAPGGTEARLLDPDTPASERVKLIQERRFDRYKQKMGIK